MENNPNLERDRKYFPFIIYVIDSVPELTEAAKESRFIFDILDAWEMEETTFVFYRITTDPQMKDFEYVIVEVQDNEVTRFEITSDILETFLYAF
ncbi:MULTISPECIES: hypothetical protein [Aquificales]|uniref:hypothetical protein n=1 Tax=Aquificales TaxID=32069 RepID=UPI00015EFFD0|nr:MULTISPECIES: hypothetical protein [Aquificales]EDP72959.1 hypothetical protein HG1285_12577 [Hydrogenivirga sp. 128-5-R1-1]